MSENMLRPVQLTEYELDAVAAGASLLDLSNLVNINNNNVLVNVPIDVHDINVAVPVNVDVNVAAAIGVLGDAFATTGQAGTFPTFPA